MFNSGMIVFKGNREQGTGNRSYPILAPLSISLDIRQELNFLAKSASRLKTTKTLIQSAKADLRF
jgi:hypothetical protein